MTIIKKTYLNIDKYNIKVIGDKWDDTLNEDKKNVTLAESRSNDNSNFNDLGLLIEYLNELHLEHHSATITVNVEIRQSSTEV
jgi:hypothetical protein